MPLTPTTRTVGATRWARLNNWLTFHLTVSDASEFGPTRQQRAAEGGTWWLVYDREAAHAEWQPSLFSMDEWRYEVIREEIWPERSK